MGLTHRSVGTHAAAFGGTRRAGERIVALARVLAENAPKHTYAPIAGASNPVQPTLS